MKRRFAALILLAALLLPLLRSADPQVNTNPGVAVLFGSASAETGGKLREQLAAYLADPYGLDGSGIRIAVIDSGVDRENPVLLHANILPGYDYFTDTPMAIDDKGHGTEVVQVLCAEYNDLGGITGIVPGAEIVPLRCFSLKGSVSNAVLAQAIVDAVDVYHCQVISMSWGLRTDNEAIRNAVRYARSQGTVLVAAAGNISSSLPDETILYPAAYPEVIGVGALDDGLNRATYSVQSGAVDLCAPGNLIPFVGADSNVFVESGTSFATPAVAGVAAILLQLLPDLTVGELVPLMKTRARDLDIEGRDNATGWGLPTMEAYLGSDWTELLQTDAGGTCVGCRFAESGFAVASVYEKNGRMDRFAYSAAENGMAVCTIRFAGDEVCKLLFAEGGEAVPRERREFILTNDPQE